MITFFGTSHHSAQFLEKAIQNGLKVDLVVSSPPKPVGKKQILTENPTVTIAKKEKIPFILTLSDLKNIIPSPSISLKVDKSLSSSQQEKNSATPLRSGQNDVGLILDFNKIIPNDIIKLFPKGIINIHFSKLPQYRGPAPVQYTILNGEKQAWITYYLIDENLDTGKIITQTNLPLNLTETTETLYQKLITKAASEIPQIIDNYLYDRYHTCQQTGKATYTQKLTTKNCQINWEKPPEQIERLIRAASPEPGAWTFVEISPKSAKTPIKKRLKILKAHLENGKLILDLVQLEGKNPVTWKQFQEGYPNFKIEEYNK